MTDNSNNRASEHPVVLEAKGIRKSFIDLEVLKGIDLKAHEHDVISIIGSSGSGKSTFLRCLNFLEYPTEGEVIFRNQAIDVKRTSANSLEPTNSRQVESLRTKMGMVFQGFNLWAHMTAIDNVMAPQVRVLKRSKQEARTKAEEALAKVGLSDRSDHYPSQLSGGQQQRCAIARVLAMDPEVILFDEPTSALDPELVGEVLKVMLDISAEGRTMIIVTHEMGFAREASNEVIFLDQGKIAEQGPPSQLFANPSTERCKEYLSSML